MSTIAGSATIKVSIIKTETGDSTSVIAVSTDILGRSTTISGTIQIDGNVLANCLRRYIVFYGDGGGTGRGIAVDIGHGQGFGIGPYFRAVEAGLAEAEVRNSTVVVAAIVDSRGGVVPLPVGSS